MTVVEAKFLSLTALKKPSGQSLLIFLASLLLLFTLVFDLTAGRGLGRGISLSLPLIVCALLSGGLGYSIVPILRRLKAAQVMQEDGLPSHLKKAGTPTMGGVIFVPATVVIALLWSRLAPAAIAVSVVTLAYGVIGWIDDWQILRQQSNKGISPATKLMLQIAVAVLFCIWMLFTQPESITNIALAGNFWLPLGILFWPLAGFVLVAESNATNLTDGVDGLAGGTVAIALLGLGAIAAPNFPELAIFCACLSGGCLGFVVHNRNPATVFMGDTGSLFLGGTIGLVALCIKQELILVLVGGVFVVEALSVLIQVASFSALAVDLNDQVPILRSRPIGRTVGDDLRHLWELVNVDL